MMYTNSLQIKTKIEMLIACRGDNGNDNTTILTGTKFKNVIISTRYDEADKNKMKKKLKMA